MDQEQSWHKLIHIDFVWFCSTLIRCILPPGNPRALYPSQLSLAVDLLEDLDLDELRGVQNQLAALTASEHPVLAIDLYEQGLPVRDYYTKRLLNRIDALPAGNVYHSVQIEAQQDVSHVRQMYLSTSMFDDAAIFRGSFQSLRVEYRHTHGVLLLWKKKDTSHVFLQVHPRDLSQLIASHWSAILFWNNDGSIATDNTDNTPEQNTNVDPPPGLPPQQNNGVARRTKENIHEFQRDTYQLGILTLNLGHINRAPYIGGSSKFPKWVRTDTEHRALPYLIFRNAAHITCLCEASDEYRGIAIHQKLAKDHGMIGMVVHPQINSQSLAIFIRGDHSVGTFIELLGHHQCETENKSSKFWLLHGAIFRLCFGENTSGEFYSIRLYRSPSSKA